MSITFWVPQAPTLRVQPWPEEFPEDWSEVPAEPFTELNLSNINACAILASLGYRQQAEDGCGTWGLADLAEVRRRIMRVLNSPKEAKRLEVPDEMGRNYLYIGRDAEYVQDRLTRLLSLVSVAADHGFYVSFG